MESGGSGLREAWMGIGRRIGVRKMGRCFMEMGDSCHVTEVACGGSGGFAALRAPAGWLGESGSGLPQSVRI